jgi:hypothetical protein
MALTDEGGSNNGMIMPVTPMGGGYGNSNSGFGGDWGSWIILFLIFGMFGGWGNGGYGGGGFNNTLSYDFPWLLNGQNGINANTNSGFDHAATQSALSGIQNAVTSGFGDTALGIAGINQNICQTGNNIVGALTGGFANAETAATTRQMANMNQAFAAQTSMNQGFNGLQSQLANCCCENRLASANLQNVVQTENCADRAALSDGIRDIIANQTAGTQRILDMMCQNQIEQKNDTIAQLRSELMYARGQASQDVQTAAIQAGQRALANEVEQYVAPMPRPAYIVQNPNCCSPNYGCGCGSF